MKKSIGIKLISLAISLTFIFQTCSVAFGTSINLTTKEDLINPLNNSINVPNDDNVQVEGEIVLARSEYTKTFKLEDGTFFTLYSSIPIHAKGNDGWQDIFDYKLGNNMTMNSVERKFNSVISNSSSVIEMEYSERLRSSARSDSERMIVNGSNSIGFNMRFIDNSNTGNSIHKYQSLWLQPYNLSNSFDDFQTVTVSAKIILNCQNSNYTNGNIVPVNVYTYRVLSPWDLSVNYIIKGTSFNNNQPSANIIWLKNQILDAVSVSNTGNYSFDITDCFCKWERGLYDNNGVVFTSNNNRNSLTVGGYSFSRRFRIIDESDSNFEYKTIDMGRAGKVYVNEFTNTVKIIRNEIEVFDELMPVSISRILDFGKNYLIPNPSGLGARWNYESKIGQLNSLVFFWKTLDGSTSYFTRSSGNEIVGGLQKWVNANGTIMWVDAANTINENYSNNYITDSNNYKYEFDSSGRLICISSAYSNSSQPIEIKIIYANDIIEKIIDSSGRCYKFETENINGFQCVKSLAVYKNSSSNSIVEVGDEQLKIQYNYTVYPTSGVILLTGVTYSDGETVSYEYDSNNDRITSIISNNGNVLNISYNGNSRCASRLEKKASNQTNANILELVDIDSHNTYQRVITVNEQTETIGYNHLLDINYRKDSEGNEYYMQYDANGSPIQALIPEDSQNLLSDPGFEEEDDLAWSFLSVNTEFDYDFSPTGSDISLKAGYTIDGISGVSQTVHIEGESGDSFAFGCYGYSQNIIPIDERFIGIVIYESNAQGDSLNNTPIGSVNFDNAIVNETQYIFGSLTLNSDVEYINFNVISSRQSKDVWFDDLSLYKVSNGIIDLTSIEELSNCGCENCQNDNCLCECENGNCNTCICCATQTIEIRNSFGNVIKSGVAVNGKEYSSANSYNPSGSYLTKTTDLNGIETNYTYNFDNGMLEKVKEGTNADINYTYNAMGMLTEVSQAVASISNTNASVQYSFTHDRLSSITHNGITYNFIYDDYGNCTSEQVKDSSQSQRGITNYSYNNLYDSSCINTITYGNGDSIHYTYNSDNNIVSITLNDDISPKYEYTYNLDGSLASSVDNETGFTTTYNNDGGYTVIDSNNQTIYSTSINNDGQIVENVLGTTYVSGDQNIAAEGEYSYNCLTGESHNQTIISGAISQDIKTDIITDEFNRITNKNHSTKTEYYDPYMEFNSVYEYNDTPSKATGQINSLTTTHRYIPSDGQYYFGISDNYAYDSNGRLTNITRNKNLQLDSLNQYSQSTSYYYDSNGQVVREDNQELYKTFVYNYNPYGNISSVETYQYTTASALGTPISTDFYSYDSNYKDLLVSFNSQSLTYDAVGNPLTLGSDYNFEWQGKQLVGYKYPYTMDDNYGDTYAYQRQEFFYDSEGNRTKKVSYLIDHNNVESLQLTTIYIWNEGKLIAQQTINPGGSVGNTYRYLYDSNGEAYGLIVNNSGLFYYVKDQFGSVIEIYSESNHKCVVSYYYDAWGNMSYTTHWDNIGQYLGALLIAMNNSITYKSYFYDQDANIYLLKSRYYSPQWRRFINSDNLYITGHGVFSANLYSYCANDPVNMVDPKGNAYTGNATSTVSRVIASITGDILLALANVPRNEIKTLQSSITNLAEYLYVSTVIYNGRKRATRSFEVCRSFTKKTVSTIVGKYYGWVENLGAIKIKKEIFAHSMLYYYYGNVKSLIGEENAAKIRKHADPIDLGGNPWYYTLAFETIWATSKGT